MVADKMELQLVQGRHGTAVSYMSRWNLTTKSMSAAGDIMHTMCHPIHLVFTGMYRHWYMIGRRQSLTEAVLFWNRRKIATLPAHLTRTLQKVAIIVIWVKQSLLSGLHSNYMHNIAHIFPVLQVCKTIETSKLDLLNLQPNFHEEVSKDTLEQFKAMFKSLLEVNVHYQLI